ncbi:MAG: error-prone DNA polymerase [Acidithiobacillus ferrooxidans]|nr:error-prone DNA polymerase [Acidithiobacillus ferrooxidans]
MCRAILPEYAELHCLSALSFLRGASAVEDLLDRAQALGYRALAITEECSLGSAARAHSHARNIGFPLILGSEIALTDGPRIVLLVRERDGYVALSRFITRARGRAGKGHYQAHMADLPELMGCLAIILPDSQSLRFDAADAIAVRDCLGAENVWLGVELLRGGDDAAQLREVLEQGRALDIPCLACGDVHMDRRSRRFLQDVLTAIRLRRPLADLGWALARNGERHLRPRPVLAELYPPELLAETLRVAERCQFSLDSLVYRYPDGACPAGQQRDDYLAELARQGLQRRYPQGVDTVVATQLEAELALVRELDYAGYFLTVHDIVQFAKGRGILCQGRGSAANSVICYALGITEVDPSRMQLLFARFISRDRREPPDIDVDFEHERREEVIQYVFQHYGRDHAALTATIIHYRPRSAMRDAARALGFAPVEIQRLTQGLAWWDGRQIRPERLQEQGFDPTSPTIQRLITVVNALVGFPRHLSQHVGGMVLSATPLNALVPIEPAAMAERTVIQWDKDDLDVLGILKVDILALGMLSVLRRALDDLGMTLADIPAEDPATYAMLQCGESLGVFQVESRAQMSMLPRLKPRCFYDLVIEVAIIRPGPIQGDMVHPYLRRRQGLEPVRYPGPEVKKVLERTLGVPIFQEQVMQIAIDAAGFSGDEADGLRRAMAAWRRKGHLGPYTDRLIHGLRLHGYSEAFAQRLCQQIQGFAEYGFPESHAASFALLVYASAWIKCHHPAIFTAALLNSQPMGFYAPAQIVQEAQRRGVEILSVDICHSDWDCQVQDGVLRLGLCLIKGLSPKEAERLLHWRAQGGALHSEALRHGLGLSAAALHQLAHAGALSSLHGDRHQALWAVQGSLPLPTALPMPVVPEQAPALPAETSAAACIADYQQLGLSLGPHPLHFLRKWIAQSGYRSIAEVRMQHHGRPDRLAGLVTHRQRPGTAHGTVFLTLEDESGMINVIVWPQRAEGWRRALLQGRLLGIGGRLERQGASLHFIADAMEDLSPWLGTLSTRSRDFH